MAELASILKQRYVWTALMGLAALAFWVVGLGTGWRGWILGPNAGGIVAKTQAFGEQAYVWWIPAAVLTLTTVTMAIGAALIRHLVDGPVEVLPEKDPLPEVTALPEKQPLPGDEAPAADDRRELDESSPTRPALEQEPGDLLEKDGTQSDLPATDRDEDESDR